MKNTSFRATSYITILLVSGSMFALNSSFAQTTADQKPGRTVEKSRLTKVDVESAILKTIHSTTLAAQLPGILIELKVQEGDRVTTGQSLGRINDDAIRLKLDQLRIQVEMAKKRKSNNINERLAEKTRQVADNELTRALAANSRVADTYPINEIDRLRLVADQAKLEVERAIHEQELAGFNYEVAVNEYKQSHELFKRHQIVAPTDGEVVGVSKRIGEWVEPGTDLLRVVSVDKLRVEGFVNAQQTFQELVGLPAEISTQHGDSLETSTGRVVFVSPDMNPANGTVRIFIDVSNANKRLRPGAKVSAQIFVGSDVPFVQ